MKLRRQLAAFLSGDELVPAARSMPAVAEAPAEARSPRTPAQMLWRGDGGVVWLEPRQAAAIRELLESCARSFVAPDKHVRANMMTFSQDRSQRQVHSDTAYNMEHDADRSLSIGANAAASGKAVTQRRAAVADLVLLQIMAEPAWGLRAAEQALVRPTLKSILSVPIFNPEDINGPLLGTLQVDSDLTLEEAGFDRPESAELLQQFADVLSLLLLGVPVRIGAAQRETAMAAPKSRVQNASQVEPGLYVANRSTSIYQLSKDRST